MKRNSWLGCMWAIEDERTALLMKAQDIMSKWKVNDETREKVKGISIRKETD